MKTLCFLGGLCSELTDFKEDGRTVDTSDNSLEIKRETVPRGRQSAKLSNIN